MNIYYLISVIVGRVSNLLTLILLSYLLNVHDFGVYTSIATNALFAHIIFGSWISSYAWREISRSSKDNIKPLLGDMRRLMLLSSSLQVGVFALVLVLTLTEIDWRLVLLAMVWSILTLFVETTFVVQNAVGRSKEFAALTFLRGSSVIILSVTLVLCGLGIWGALFGAVFSAILTLAAFRNVRSLWLQVGPSTERALDILTPLKFGLASVFALNIYIIVNALSRNIILIDLGAENAGYASLAADLFYAPIALIATSLSLSITPELYRAHSVEAENSTEAASNFITSNAAAALPYIVGGLFVADAIAARILNAETGRHIAEIAPLAAVQGGCFAMISTQTTIALTMGRVRVAVGFSVATILLVVLLQLSAASYDSLYVHSLAVTIALVAMAVIALLCSRRMLKVAVQPMEVVKIVAATGAMSMVLIGARLVNLPLSPIPEVLLAGVIFLAVAKLVSSSSVDRLIKAPSR